MSAGKKAVLSGFGDDRDGKVVTIVSEKGATAVVEAPDYRANISKRRIELLDEGAAGVVVELTGGILTVKHQEGGRVLIKRPVARGFWTQRLWTMLEHG